jgi:SAM-dependent methyltransferase
MLKKSLLAHPLTCGLDLDDPRTTALRRRIIQEKSFLRQIYREWYSTLASDLPTGAGAAIELGSGAGFLKDFVPDLVTSDVFNCAGIDIVLSGLDLPIKPASLRAIVMVDVLHHLPQARNFFREAARCVRPGGVVAMIEPWVRPGPSWFTPACITNRFYRKHASGNFPPAARSLQPMARCRLFCSLETDRGLSVNSPCGASRP